MATNYLTSTQEYTELFSSPMAIIISLALLVITIAGWWKMFEKAGTAGWKAVVPFYCVYCIYEIAFGKGKGWLFILLLIPCVNLVLCIILNIKLSHVYGKGTGFTIGMVLLPVLFYLILGYGNASYIGPDVTQE